MAPPLVDLSQVSVLAEIIVRGGDVGDPNARTVLQRRYEPDPDYPDVVGLSTVFREGATLDELAREAAFPHAKLSWSVVGRLLEAVQLVGYELALFVTPTAEVPDHHTLAVALGGVVEQTLPDAAADALIRTLQVVQNPYQRKH